MPNTLPTRNPKLAHLTDGQLADAAAIKYGTADGAQYQRELVARTYGPTPCTEGACLHADPARPCTCTACHGTGHGHATAVAHEVQVDAARARYAETYKTTEPFAFLAVGGGLGTDDEDW
jgi:hypothetical protein